MKKITSLFIACLVINATASAQIISTIAGNGTSANTGDGGSATAASLGYPFWGACDRFDNYYFGTLGKIRKISASGIITTITGTAGTAYSGDGAPATAAGISVQGFYCDWQGNLYIADNTNHRIRKIDVATGIITTVVGTGAARTASTPSGDGGPATDAIIAAPNMVCFDHSGNMYISEWDCIRKINTAGIITTIAGKFNIQGSTGDGGPATDALLNSSSGLCCDKYGNVYISMKISNTECRIRKINIASGIITTVVGGGVNTLADGEVATNITLVSGSQIIVTDADEIYFYINNMQNKLLKVNASGIISTVAGNGTGSFCGDGGAPISACFNAPFGIATDRCNNIYIADYFNQRIRKIDYFYPCPPVAVTAVKKNDKSVLFYPNPANDVITVETEGINTISISDLLGRKLFSNKFNNTQEAKIDIRHFPPGTYILFVNGHYSGKFLKN